MDLITFFTQVVNAFLHFYITGFFFKSFLNFRIKRIYRFFVLALLTAFLSAALMFFENGILRFVAVLFLTFVQTLLYEAKWYQRGVYMAIAYSLEAMIEVFAGMFLQVIFNVKYDGDMRGNTFLIGMLLSKILIFIVFVIIKVLRKNTAPFSSVKYSISIFAFPFVTLLVGILSSLYWINTETISAEMTGITIIIFAFLFPANLVIFDFIDTASKNAENEAKLAVANEIIGAQVKQYEALVRHNKDIMKIRHDQKHFCIGLLADLRSGNIDSAIDQLTCEFNLRDEESSYSENAVLTLINVKKRSAAEENIDITVEHSSLNSIVISSTDLAVVLGNALDNAVEACRKLDESVDKAVNVSINIKDDLILIRVVNPTCENVNINGLSTSKKNDTGEHGFGILSMKQIAKKYNGEIVISCENKRFSVLIMLENKCI